jgi:hypothetical protein
MHRPLVIAVAAILSGPVSMPAQDTPRDLADAAQWKLDRITLRSGETHEGLVESESEGSIRFLEIRRPEGRAMFGVYLAIDRRQIQQIERLTETQREQTRQRFEQFRNRARVEAGKMEDLSLETTEVGGVAGWRYHGPWFWLESTADEETTRRAIVRVEQVFAAYRQLLPPRAQPESAPRILLFGSTAQYRGFLQSIRLPVENPAFFAMDANLVVAGTDIARFAGQLAQVRTQHDGLRNQLDDLRQALPDRLREKREQLDRTGSSEPAKRKALLNYKRQYEDELAVHQRLLDTYDRKNAALFEEATNQMFSTLYHEAFHAWLENYAYPHERHDVPRWLNEGLAQVFEAGILEGSTLRVDAPNKAALAALQADLKSREPLPLARLLAADHRSFLVVHSGGTEASARHYAYSWGLAHYLAFEQPVLGSKALDAFVGSEAAAQPPVARFEALVGKRLSDFEVQWRKYILGLKSNGAGRGM